MRDSAGRQLYGSSSLRTAGTTRHEGAKILLTADLGPRVASGMQPRNLSRTVRRRSGRRRRLKMAAYFIHNDPRDIVDGTGGVDGFEISLLGVIGE